MPPKSFPDFEIVAIEPISEAFRKRGIYRFYEAIDFIKQLPYGRNADKKDLTSVFSDACGTCSTKHALLRQLSIENQISGIKLMLCIFRMHVHNSPRVAHTLSAHRLAFIPEAHNYLLAGNEIVDCTRRNASKDDFVNDLIMEIEIAPEQITAFKVNYHQNYLAQWLSGHPDLKYTLEEVYEIREQCIRDLETR